MILVTGGVGSIGSHSAPSLLTLHCCRTHCTRGQ
jgi:uncharacterized protein YbjT (DUF2867 family)